MPMVMAGTLLLAFGWFGFTTGSAAAVASGRIGLIAVNTVLASAASALAATIFMWRLYGNPDPSVMCNGMLGGLVAISACCAFVSPFMAFFVGAVAGVIVPACVLYLERHGLDDPIGAISVHGAAGVWGMLALGLFADGTFGSGYNGVSGNVTGFFYGDHSLSQLLAQIIAVIICIAWNILVGGVLFELVGRLVGGNRVSTEVELNGLDIPELGVSGYPEFLTSFADEKTAARSRANL
jgi:Amt family ammonium transporter